MPAPTPAQPITVNAAVVRKFSTTRLTGMSGSEAKTTQRDQEGTKRPFGKRISNAIVIGPNSTPSTSRTIQGSVLEMRL